MILHVAGPNQFTLPFVKLVKEEFQDEAHQFWFTGPNEKYPVELGDGDFLSGRGLLRKFKGYLRLVKQLHDARMVMIHGLFDPRLVILLSLFPYLSSKLYWVIWGNDLYQYRENRKIGKHKFKEIFRKFVIKRIGHLVTYIDGDVELARQWYGAKGTHHECIMYLSNVVDPKMITEPGPASDHDGLNILLGNSADPSNNHIEALERLLPFKDQPFKIYAPLSYGDQNHAQKVISQGKAWFGDKFVPMTEFMPFEQYLEFLKSLDIAIFNHQRQQAMGNTITLLGMGKTVFMRSDVSHWRFLTGLGIKLNDVEKLELCRIARDEADENARVVYSYFSRATLMKQLANIFEG